MYIYFLIIFLIFHHLRKSLLSQVLVLFISILCFASYFSLFLYFFFFHKNQDISDISSRGRFLHHSSNLKPKYSNIQISYLSSLFYYIIFCYLSHERKRLNARRRYDHSMEQKRLFYKLFQ